MISIKRIAILLIAASLTIVGSNNVFAQEGGGEGPPRNKHYEKEKKKREKDSKKAEKEAFKRHEMIQDKATRKRMKKNRKRAERQKKNKKDPFFQRIFRKG